MLSGLYVACFLFAIAVGAIAPSVPPAVVFPQQTGNSVRYHVTRTTQAADGTRATTADVTIVRKTSTTAALSRTNANGRTDLTVLLIASDGSIQIPADDQVDRQDADLQEVLAGLNRAIAVVRNAVNDPRSSWNATLPLTNTHGAETSLTVPMYVVRSSGPDWDIRGAAQLTIETAPQRSAQTGTGGGSGFPGGGRGNGFPGGSFPGGGDLRRGSRGTSGGNSPATVYLRIEGRVHNGLLSRLSIVETRAITLDAMPFTNTSGWTIEASSGV
jgi:uncharacterized membrane protein YgcG